jgi:hypothetical protein
VFTQTRPLVREGGIEPPLPKRRGYGPLGSPHCPTRGLGCLAGFEPANSRFTAESLSHLGQGTVLSEGIEPAVSWVWARHSPIELAERACGARIPAERAAGFRVRVEVLPGGLEPPTSDP